jgi:hypothetical protein
MFRDSTATSRPCATGIGSQLLLDAGFTLIAKDPLAVCLTQISRSAAIRHSTGRGLYELDRRRR